MNTVQRILRRLLEPARDPLSDSLGLSLGRLAGLRTTLERQIVALRRHAGQLVDSAIEAQIFQLESEYRKLLEVERRVTSELDVHRTQRDILSARQTAAQAQERMSELICALDEAHAHAAALAESVIDVGV
jgi:phage shock protein A